METLSLPWSTLGLLRSWSRLLGACSDLRWAWLGKANLSGASLTTANLRWAYLEGAEYDQYTKFPEGFIPEEKWMILSLKLLIKELFKSAPGVGLWSDIFGLWSATVIVRLDPRFYPWFYPQLA